MDSFSATSARMPALRSSIDNDPSRYRVLTGERPTGQLHLGHYVGTIRERVRLQDAGVETFVILADYQVITDRETAGAVRENVYSAVLDYLAAGIDPKKSAIFVHSAIPELNQLFLPFLSLVTEAELHRNPTVKSDLLSSGRALNGLLLTYPVHQAADILFCKGNLVPVGKDNLPHVEVTRSIARRFNERYGEVFPEPEALITKTPELPGLDGRKMSKSYGNTITLAMSEDETAQRIRKAPTDSERTITYDPDSRPGVSALLDTASVCLDRAPEDVADEIGSKGSGALKALVAEAVNESLRELRQRRSSLVAADAADVLKSGNRAARRIAVETLDETREAMGMIY
ncbi:tryptophan--tRNA ligase [Dermacoccus nishinomiyaensis]|uniref:tryptophan--tRNA ligase n=1 Tax=Dermacoccus nishinomiyaensis TaxID=1274 RepID=UPI00093B0750|nr:tryptophan--tRNA ligase [Dermacoccus nishinomiyaensis]